MISYRCFECFFFFLCGQNYRSSQSSSNQTSPGRSRSLHQFVPEVLQPPQNDGPGEGVQSSVEGLSILQRTYGTQEDIHGEVVETTVSPDSVLSLDPGTINSHDRIALYQDYDGSNTEV